MRNGQYQGRASASGDWDAQRSKLSGILCSPSVKPTRVSVSGMYANKTDSTSLHVGVDSTMCHTVKVSSTEHKHSSSKSRGIQRDTGD